MFRGPKETTKIKSGRGPDCYRNQEGSRSQKDLYFNKQPTKEKPKENLPFSFKKTKQ